MAKRLVKSFIQRWHQDSNDYEENEPSFPTAVEQSQNQLLPSPPPLATKRANSCTACSSWKPLKCCLDNWDAVDGSGADTVLYSWSPEPIHRLPPEEQLPPCEMCFNIQNENMIGDGCHEQRENLRKYLSFYSNLKKRVEEAKDSQNISLSAIDADTSLQRKMQNCKDLFAVTTATMSQPNSVITPSQALACCNQLQYEFHEAELLYPVQVHTVLTELMPFLEDILRVMREPLAQHQGSELCTLCNNISLSPEGLAGPDGRLHQLSPAGLAQIFRDHPIPWNKGEYRHSLVDKVQILLQTEGPWKGLKFQEYELDPMAPFVPPTTLDSDSTLTPPDLDRMIIRKATEEGFRAAYRRLSKDESLYVPLSSDKPGFARVVQPRFDISLIKEWLGRCHSDHGSRCMTERSGLRPKNLIMIDTEKNCLVTLTDGPRPPYLALSYVWGGVAQTELTKLTLDEWHKPGSLEEESRIPQKVRDAMSITRQTGLRYLWVDALCIVQDDDYQRQEQINQMFLIYNQAEATIVAADGPSSDQGLSGITRFEARERIDKPYHIQGTPMARVLQDPRAALQASQWRKRGWTLQEEVCSTRAIIFLPSVVLFSCPTTAWREDLHLENVQGAQMDPILNSLPRALDPHRSTSEEELITIFRRVVQQYTQRTLTREDDMENAFAGVSTIMQRLIGPIYYGIPERFFSQVVAGCWFWGMCCPQRAGFPSWSWMGWMYTKEQADAGIEPSSWSGETAGLLAFFKLFDGVESLPEPVLESPVLDSLQPELREHFNPDLEEIQSRYTLLASTLEELPRGLICFYTSCNLLKLRPLYKNAASSVQEYLVLNPKTSERLTTIYLEEEQAKAHGEIQPFIVIAAQRGEVGKTGLRLMLVRMMEHISYKINVTSQRKLVDEAAWWELNPSKRLVVMG